MALAIVSINVFSFMNMESDANIINQAGKLRMLSYNMAQLSNRIITQRYLGNVDLALRLEMRVEEFESIMQQLSGNNDDYSSGIKHPQTADRLRIAAKEWCEVYKPAYLSVINNELADNSIEKINNSIDSYVGNINEMVNSYSAYARSKITRALAINAGLVLVIILVTFYSFISTNKRIGRPMKVLMQDLKELSLIDDDVTKKLRAINADEISEMAEYFSQMMYDQLTTAFSRRAGLAKLNRMLQQDSRRHIKLSLCFVDINGLKDVNDQLGHRYGDELIVSVVKCIKDEIREDDFVIRMGGDEFLVVLSGVDRKTAEKVWDRVKQRYEQINKKEDRRYIISVSHGIDELDSYESPDVESVIKNADDKMYAEKKYIKEELKAGVIRV